MVRARRKSTPVLSLLIGFCLAVAVGAASLGFYRYVYQNWEAAREQTAAVAQIEESFETPQPGEPMLQTTAEGDQLAIIVRIPRFGDDFARPVYEGGASDATLDLGIVHYPETAMPCEVGNLALTAHRTTHGKAFARIKELTAGDLVVVETTSRVCTYAVDGVTRVDPEQVEILDPTPSISGMIPVAGGQYVTLITCAEFGAYARDVAFGHLVSVQVK